MRQALGRKVMGIERRRLLVVVLGFAWGLATAAMAVGPAHPGFA